MASSKVMASSSTTNPDLPRHHLNQSPPPAPPSLTTQTHPLYHSSSTSLESVNMEEILKNMYTEPESLDAPCGSVSINGTATGVAVGPRMTLEDFLAKAGAVSEEDVVVVQVPPAPAPAQAVSGGDYGVDGHGMMGLQFPAAPGPVVHMQQNGAAGLGTAEAAKLGYGGNGMVAATIGNGGRGGRGKRRGAPAEEMVLDKATQQKQKRMIKNRESAARSRERKQAYTVELETLVTQLEEENARLLRQEAEQNKKRLKQLMENLIPVEEKRRLPPPRSLRRVHSMSW